MRKNSDDALFLDGEQKKGGGPKASGKTRNGTAGKGDRQVITDLNCLIYLAV